MKIIILGAGQVGSNLAQSLVREASDITVVDISAERLQLLQDRIDIRTIHGMASHPQILRQAGAEDADMLIAVTSSDEINMVACQVAYSIFQTPTKIARIRSRAYFTEVGPGGRGIFRNEAMPVDYIVNPEELVTDDIRQLIEFPGALQVMDFADGKVKLMAIRAEAGGPLADQEIRYLRQLTPGIQTRAVAIFRDNGHIKPDESTLVLPGDEVFLLAASEHMMKVMRELHHNEDAYHRVAIAGGGHIGQRLALALEQKNYAVKLIEQSRSRCEELSVTLNNSVVLAGDASDQDLLLEENIEDTDVFCAVTNDDEANIMASLLAKSLGAHKVITLINNMAYVDLIQSTGEIDIALSPRQSTLGSILTHIRRGDVVRVHSLRKGAAEAIEAIAHGDAESTRVIGRPVSSLKLPPGASIEAVVRSGQVLLAPEDISIEPDDHVIVFLVDKSRMPEVERLFQAPLAFF